uniref:Uncharacterized protein n=1 Tax=Pipistrellus kuhlii TaxID=59472 RepID=A0A7J7RTP6_PIPKU|nr:hypothetical protein mPipKuh1_010367 [Pipistrellus kuhlii]
MSNQYAKYMQVCKCVPTSSKAAPLMGDALQSRDLLGFSRTCRLWLGARKGKPDSFLKRFHHHKQIISSFVSGNQDASCMYTCIHTHTLSRTHTHTCSCLTYESNELPVRLGWRRRHFGQACGEGRGQGDHGLRYISI